LKPETSNLKTSKITSRDNSLLRQARAVRDGKLDELIFVEGLRLGEEALRSNLQIEAVIYSDQFENKPRAAELVRDLGKVTTKLVSVGEKLLESISYTKTPQGIVILAPRPVMTPAKFEACQSGTPFLVILHGINNPVNVGAILRTAEAAGVTGIITTAGTADPLSPKSLRGAMGSTFRLPIWPEAQFEDAIAWCRTRGIRTFGANAKAQNSYAAVDWYEPSALVMGTESAGLSRDDLALVDKAVSIPMKGETESLNVAVAAGIILYEAQRQRATQ
jgi:RNA methyltransferase, TrmH family